MNERSVFPGLALAGLLLAASLTHAADIVRPRVGLVLGGGGARGAAHIGVLEVLEKLRVPVDCVAGTSMGGLVAGAFAAGLTPIEMRTELAKADWNDMFLDSPPYNEVNLRNKKISQRFLPASETGVTSQGLTYQGGVVSGQKIKLFFNRLVGSDLGEREIETLPLPLSIIATDIGNGDKVVLRSGSLTKAMRASMSVPGLMSPVDYQGRKLVDGGLVDNVPIDVVRDHCQADIVIAVNVGSPLLKAEDVGSLFTVAAQMVNILTEQNVTRSLAKLGPGDIYIQPDLEGISAGDFVKSSETADRGRQAALAVADRLQALAVSDEAYSAWINRIAYARPEPPVINEIQVAELKTVNPAAVERHFEVRSGERQDVETLDRDMLRIFGDGWFESVDYTLSTARDRNILRVLPAEKNWGPDYLRFGINLESNFREDSTYSLRVAYDKTWLNPLGGQLIVAAEIGNTPGLLVDYYQPLEAQQRYFFESALGYGGRTFNLYQNDDKLAEYWRTRGLVSAGFGINIGLLGQVRTGWRHNWQEATLDTGTPSATFPAKAKESYGGEYMTVDFDQTNRLFFPTKGWSSKLHYFNSSKADYSKVNAEVMAFYPIGDYVISSRLTYQGSLNGQLPYYDAGSLGGFANLSGFTPQELVGDNIRYGHIRAEKIVGKFPLGLRGDLRAGVVLEAGKVGTPYTQTQLSGWLKSAAVYFGGETPLGPFYLGYGQSDSGSSNFYLLLGTP